MEIIQIYRDKVKWMVLINTIVPWYSLFLLNAKFHFQIKYSETHTHTHTHTHTRAHTHTHTCARTHTNMCVCIYVAKQKNVSWSYSLNGLLSKITSQLRVYLTEVAAATNFRLHATSRRRHGSRRTRHHSESPWRMAKAGRAGRAVRAVRAGPSIQIAAAVAGAAEAGGQG